MSLDREWFDSASGIAKSALKHAIESRDGRNACVRNGWVLEESLYSQFTRRWARDCAITVREWNLDPRTGNVKGGGKDE